ncbi:MAG: hypothetical protein IH628_16125 [Proteobacteria bacterium]|nr:hypothetical protein [Pseudomonadota bacterium]
MCVVCGKPLCHLCRNGEASPALCGSEDHETVAAEWVRVFQSPSEFEGDSVVCNLKARGIPVKVFSSRRYLGARTAGASDAVRVFVKKNDFGRAEECLTEVTGALDDEPNNVD